MVLVQPKITVELKCPTFSKNSGTHQTPTFVWRR